MYMAVHSNALKLLQMHIKRFYGRRKMFSRYYLLLNVVPVVQVTFWVNVYEKASITSEKLLSRRLDTFQCYSYFEKSSIMSLAQYNPYRIGKRNYLLTTIVADREERIKKCIKLISGSLQDGITTLTLLLLIHSISNPLSC